MDFLGPAILGRDVKIDIYTLNEILLTKQSQLLDNLVLLTSTTSIYTVANSICKICTAKKNHLIYIYVYVY